MRRRLATFSLALFAVFLLPNSAVGQSLSQILQAQRAQKAAADAQKAAKAAADAQKAAKAVEEAQKAQRAAAEAQRAQRVAEEARKAQEQVKQQMQRPQQPPQKQQQFQPQRQQQQQIQPQRQQPGTPGSSLPRLSGPSGTTYTPHSYAPSATFTPHAGGGSASPQPLASPEPGVTHENGATIYTPRSSRDTSLTPSPGRGGDNPDACLPVKLRYFCGAQCARGGCGFQNRQWELRTDSRRFRFRAAPGQQHAVAPDGN